MTRPVDIDFGAREKLWRRIEKKQIKSSDGKLKPSSLRLQVSVVRQKHGTQDSVTDEKYNGIAEIEAGNSHRLKVDQLETVVVDEPLNDIPGHTLIAIVSTPGSQVDEVKQQELRQRLAEEFVVIQQPT